MSQKVLGGGRRRALACLGLALFLGAGAGGAEAGGGPRRPHAKPQPFQRQFALDWPDGEGLVQSTYVVPGGKRLVIEYASLFAYLQPEGQSMFVRIETVAEGAGAFHNLAVLKQEDYGVLKQFGAAHTVKLYADPGSTVRVSVGRVPFNSIANATVTLSGYLEPAP